MYEEKDNVFFRGRNTVRKTEAVIIFTTPQVINKPDVKFEDNAYGRTKGKAGEGKWLDIVQKFIKKERGEWLDDKFVLYFLEADHIDFNRSRNTLIDLFYALQKKEVWVNLTGGSNVINLSLFFMTMISGITGRAYYTYTSHSELLRPASHKNFWRPIPVLKADFDTRYIDILTCLETTTAADDNGWVKDEDLRSELNRLSSFQNLNITSLRQDFLNKLHGWLIERDEDKNRNRISASGREFLELVEENEVLRALLTKKKLDTPPKIDDLCRRISID